MLDEFGLFAHDGYLCLLLCGFAHLGLLVGVSCVLVCVVVYSLRWFCFVMVL